MFLICIGKNRIKIDCYFFSRKCCSALYKNNTSIGTIEIIVFYLIISRSRTKRIVLSCCSRYRNRPLLKLIPVVWNSFDGGILSRWKVDMSWIPACQTYSSVDWPSVIHLNGKGNGDQYVRMNIEVPKTMNEKQKAAVKNLESLLSDKNYAKQKSFREKLKSMFGD